MHRISRHDPSRSKLRQDLGDHVSDLTRNRDDVSFIIEKLKARRSMSRHPALEHAGRLTELFLFAPLKAAWIQCQCHLIPLSVRPVCHINEIIATVLDRALTIELTDTALRIATETRGRKDTRGLLTVALRDLVSEQEAKGKTKKCLTRVRVNPPPDARAMIGWGIDHQHLDPSRVIIHFGALRATFPFATAIASMVGRQLHLEGEVDPRRVRAEATAVLGDRSTIDVGARKVVTAMRYLGRLSGADGGPFVADSPPVVPVALQGWITHALLLGRQLTSTDSDEPRRALELATVKLDGGRPNSYELLELLSEVNRTVVVPRTDG